MPFDEMVEVEIQVIVEQIRGLNQSIEKLEQTIKDRGQKLKGHRKRTSQSDQYQRDWKSGGQHFALCDR